MIAWRLAALWAAGWLAFAAQSPIDTARQALVEGHPHKAAEILRSILASDPRNADARLLLGTALALQDLRTESLAQFHEAIRLRPDSAAAYNSLGMALSRFLDTAAARDSFEKALALDPQLAEAHVNLSMILAQAADSAQAMSHLDRAIQIAGNSPLAARACYLRAEIRREQNDLEKARADLERAVELRPDFAAAWSDLGVVRRSMLDESGALRAFEQAVRFDPRNSIAQLRAGSEYLHAGQPHEAVAHLREALRADPDNRAVLYNLERALRDDGQVEEARKVEAHMKELLARRARSSAAAIDAVKLNNQGVELEKAGQVFAALGKYQAALDLDPEHSGFRLNLALALCRLGRWDEGIVQIREVLRREPDNAEAAKALYAALEQRPRAK